MKFNYIIYDPRESIIHMIMVLENKQKIKDSVCQRVIDFLDRFSVIFYLILLIACSGCLFLTGLGYMIFPSILIGWLAAKR